MNTRPPEEGKSRAVWTAKDEATLNELNERKARVYTEHRGRLRDVLAGTGDTDTLDRLCDELIAIAEPVRDALAPFDGRVQP